MKTNILQKGFVALITVVIMSILLLSLVSVSSMAGYFNRFNALQMEYKRQASALADTCGNSALLTLAQNYAYATSTKTVISLDDQFCTIESVIDSGPGTAYSRQVLVTASAEYLHSFSKVEIYATIANPMATTPGGSSVPAVTINSWQEVE